MNGRKIREKWQGLIDTVMRFPMTVILLVAAAASNTLSIESEYNNIYSKLLVTFLLGASLYVVLQMLYERFFDHPILRLVNILAATALSAVYFLITRKSDWSVELSIRTIVIFFILFIAFLWIPAIHSRISINESFMAVFKSFFIAILFDLILYLGVVLVIGATDLLILKVNQNAYIHSANFIFILLAPIYFLSMIPHYSLKEDDEKEEEGGTAVKRQDSMAEKSLKDNITEKFGELQQKSEREESSGLTAPNRFLTTLITFVIIPITAVFTVILLLYIILNITGEFWTDSLMEPMLVAYSITVIVVYILASTVKHSFAKYFRLVFPKVLIPVVLFQTLSSILKIGEAGVTYGRYYVILFGVFATIAGILFCFLPVHKNGRIAPVLIVLSVISILPPVDAFTVSRGTQTARLEKLLIENNMLKDGTVIPNSEVREHDRTDIVRTLDYLDRMNYTKKVDFLKNYSVSNDFEKTFGFSRYGNTDKEYQSYYYSRNTNEPIPIDGYDYMMQMNIYTGSEAGTREFEIKGVRYIVRVENADPDNCLLLLEDGQGRELLRFEFNYLLNRLTGSASGKEQLSTAELTDIFENDLAAMAVVTNSVSLNEWREGKDISADLVILVHIK